MSISAISGNQNLWQSQKQANASSSGSTAASSATDSIANTGSVSAGNMAAFFQSFSSDLQSMLSQAGNTASGATTSQTAANQPVAASHPRNHHGSEGGGGSKQGSASQMTAQIGQDLSSGSLTATGISNSASTFAADVMQALRAYSSTASVATSSTVVA